MKREMMTICASSAGEEHYNYRIDAIHPGNLPSMKMPENGHQQPTVLSCLCSHLKAMKTALEICPQDAWFVILEDDTQLYMNLDWDALKRSAPRNAGIMQLTIGNASVVNNLATLAYQQQWVPWNKNHWGTGAYMATPAYAKQILAQFCDKSVVETGNHDNNHNYNESYDFSTFPDHVVADLVLYFNQPAYTPTIQFASFRDDLFGSTIHPSHVSEHIKCSEQIERSWKVRAPPFLTHKTSK